MARKLSLKDWTKWAKKLPASFEGAVARGLAVGGQRAVLLLQTATSVADAVDTGNYRRGWKYELSAKPPGVRFFNSTPYSGIIEEGRRPGARQPPVKAIEPWVRRRLGVSGDEVRSVAFAVARAIGIKGTKGKFILKKNEPEIARILTAEVELSLQKELARV